MVLEGVLSIILNKFLGDYVENLDTEQLNVGIWGGDVKLSNLIIKSSALNDLDLPIQCVYGTIGKLVLKIPYKSIYSSPTIICVEDIYLLVVPNQDVTYDADKEMKNLLDIKRRDILRIEEAKKAEADKDKPKADPNFTERLVANIIKNVQFQVKNIHIRYEDRVTNPLAPFAVGFTLNTLDVASTDENWQKAIAKEVSKIYKILELDGLSVYWNCNTQLYGNLPPSEMIKKLMEDIISKDNIPSNYTYILGPINSSARLRMNQRPEIDTPAFSIPKIHFNLDMEKLFIGVSKAQYRDLITLVDSLGRMAKGVPYRKYRPNVNTYRDHYKEWWYFAYVCVLNDIKRKNNNWDYNHMKKYRDSCREYKEMYKKYIKKLLKGPELTRFDDLERELDLSSIVILRGQVEMDIERQTKQDASKSWFSKWWGSQPSSDTNSAGADIMKEFQKEMTSEEKEKLYKAIGYTDGALPEVYPIQFIDNSGTFFVAKT
ncbi:hypothetical protein NQ317_012875 [Molorchus minor]|uniref:Chorein N-terminal domain-containing protein n=1 Tax=Molorchus minor TaxID=1323400 RepID=A0ABQ9J6Z4_9CUCU|nr:hypothetical protein NQ317_012875 [Molorchus minor]